MNPVLLLVRDNFEMNKRCIESIFAQDISVTLVVVDNSERDETVIWALDQKLAVYPFRPQIGVSRGWNFGLSGLFKDGWAHVLVPNSDTVIPPFFYRTLLECNVPFVSGVTFTDMDAVMQPQTPSLTDGPDFSAFLIRRECWEKVGSFDASMVHYCSDVDYDIRARKAGIVLHNSHVKFYHERSSTLRNASPEDRRAIQEQSNRDHQAFRAKYGCLPNELGSSFWGSHE